RPQPFFFATHVEGARRTIFVGADRRLAADAPGILVAVFLQVLTDVSGLVLAFDSFHPSVLDDELHRIFPAPVRHMRRGIPNDRAVSSARHRLDVDFTPRPGAAGEPSRLFADSNGRLRPAIGVIVRRIARNVRGEITPGFRRDVDLLAFIVDFADTPADV